MLAGDEAPAPPIVGLARESGVIMATVWPWTLVVEMTRAGSTVLVVITLPCALVVVRGTARLAVTTCVWNPLETMVLPAETIV